ncbi:MAG: YigZ family protein [Chloroflexi bacterium]|nr:YigZ family protein [Chloroflexota bacterium]
MPKSNRYRIPAATHRVEEEISRSRFITTIGYTPTVEAARDFIGAINDEFADVSHNCWAYLVGPPGSTSQIGLSDAGEPHGTAGRPMLNVLLHAGIGDICVVITRYFGGILLGKGGLVKAYSGGVQLALQTLPTIERIPQAHLVIITDYTNITSFKRLLPEYEVEILEEEYATDVTYQIKLPVEKVTLFTQAIIDLANGQALIEVISTDEE